VEIESGIVAWVRASESSAAGPESTEPLWRDPRIPGQILGRQSGSGEDDRRPRGWPHPCASVHCRAHRLQRPQTGGCPNVDHESGSESAATCRKDLVSGGSSCCRW
jgi:hypothetical protein